MMSARAPRLAEAKGTAKALPAPARRSQAVRRETAELKLLDAAMRIIGQHGSHAMTLAEVGATAGFSRSLPAHYFGNKRGLLRRVLKHVSQQFGRALAQARPRQPGLDSVLGLIDTYFIRRDTSWTTSRALFVLMAESLGPDADLRDDVARYTRLARGFLTEQISAGIQAGEIRADVIPERASELILGGLRGTLNQWLIEPSLIDLTRARDGMLVIVRALLADPHRAGGALAPASSFKR